MELNQEYLDLVERVRKIDTAAAEYMLNEAPLSPGFNGGVTIASSFFWDVTPQGWKFWDNIRQKLASISLEQAIDEQESQRKSKSIDKLPSDPKEAAKNVVDKARNQYGQKDFEDFSWWTLKRLEKRRKG